MIKIIEFTSLQKDIVAWHENRFPEAQREHVTLKGCEEMGEVASAINAEVGKNSATDKGDVPSEVADVFISMMVLMGRWYPHVDIVEEIAKKLAILTDPNSGHRAAAKGFRGEYD